MGSDANRKPPATVVTSTSSGKKRSSGSNKTVENAELGYQHTLVNRL